MRSELQDRLLGERVGPERRSPQKADVTDEGGHRLFGRRAEIEPLHHAAGEQDRRVGPAARVEHECRELDPFGVRERRAPACGAVGELAVRRIERGPMQRTERIEVECRGLPTGDRLAELGERAIEQPCDLEEAPRSRAPTLEHGEERLTGATVEPQGSRRQLAQPVDEAARPVGAARRA